MQVIHHYPPEVLELLVNTIPRLFRSKDAVLDFFVGAGTPEGVLCDLRAELASDRAGTKKAYLARSVLVRLNEDRDSNVLLRARREVVKRVVEFEDFSSCWPDDERDAKYYVAEIRRVVNVKDAFSVKTVKIVRGNKLQGRSQDDLFNAE